jgi:micrococcal nuclease
MTRRKAVFSSSVIIVVFVVAAAFVSSRVGDIVSWVHFPTVRVIGEDTSTVSRVVDGDTVELSTGEKVRYVGMNAPESVKPDWPVECFGKEASARNRELTEGKRVRLTKDVSERDRYGRLLRFVYLSDGTFVNELLVREGYARVSTFPPDVAKESIFRAAEADARAAKRGLWADGACPK